MKLEYFNPQIVLTRVDKVEEKFLKMKNVNNLTEYEREGKLRELIDKKIEDVVVKLNVPRENVHFIENYHEKRNEF